MCLLVTSPPPMITGLFSVKQKGKSVIRPKIIQEIQNSLRINKWYKEKLIFLAGDIKAARILESFGLNVYKVFDEAPSIIHEEAAFRMKHWMVFWMLQHFGEVIWIDWDTINIIKPDDHFYAYCRAYNTPKFVFIPGYHATVNCSVYYVSYHWEKAMKQSFKAKTSLPNDELLWSSILPKNVVDLKEFWWGDLVINVWLENECSWIKKNTYFAHVKTFNYLPSIQRFKNMSMKPTS